MENQKYIDSVVILNKILKLDENVILDSKTNILIDFYNVYCNYIKFNKYNTFTNYSFKKLLKYICDVFKNCKNVIIVSKEIYESEGEEYIINTLKNYSNFTYYIVRDKNKKNSGKNRERDDFYLLYKFFLYSNDSKLTYIISNDKFKNYKNILCNIKPLDILRIDNNGILNLDIDMLELNNIKSMLESKDKNLINKIKCDFINN